MEFFYNTSTRRLTRSITDARVITSANFKARDAVIIDLQLHDGENAVPVNEYEALLDAYTTDYAAWQITHAVWEVEQAAWQVLQDAYTAALATWTAGTYATWVTAHAAWVTAHAAWVTAYAAWVVTYDDYQDDLATWQTAYAAHTIAVGTWNTALAAWNVAYGTPFDELHDLWEFYGQYWTGAYQTLPITIAGTCTTSGDLPVQVNWAGGGGVQLDIPLTTGTHTSASIIATAIAAAINANATLAARYTATASAAVVTLVRDVQEAHDEVLSFGIYIANETVPAPLGVTSGGLRTVCTIEGEPPPMTEPVYSGPAAPTAPVAPTAPTYVSPGSAPVEPVEPVEPTDSPTAPDDEPAEPAEPELPVEPVDAVSPQMVFAIKDTEVDGGITFALVDEWEHISLGKHRARISLNTEPLEEAVADLKKISAVSEFTLNLLGEGWESSNTLATTIDNDVVKGDEGTPTEATTPDDDWVAHGHEQTLTAPQQTQARENIGSEHLTRTTAEGAPANPVAAVAQVETLTVIAAGGATSSGNLTVGLAGTWLGGAPVPVNVPLLTGTHTTDALIAEAIRVQIIANSLFAAAWTVTRSGAVLTMTRTVAAANDGTSNFYIVAGLGVTAVANSTNTTLGNVASGVTPDHIGQFCRVGDAAPYSWYQAATLASWIPISIAGAPVAWNATQSVWQKLVISGSAGSEQLAITTL